jgi:hypothetical protein
VVAAGAALAAGLTLAAVEVATVGDALAALGGVAVIAAQLRPSLRQRLGLELAGALVAVVGILVAADDVDWGLPIALTISGASLTVPAVWRSDRRVLAYAGGALLASATWVRLVVEDVSTVELYTLPSALALLVSGVYRMYRSPGSSFAMLGPGLSLALLPSLLVAVIDPTSPRALALGLAGVCIVVAGAAERWAAPMFMGGGVVAVLVLVNLAPYAQAVPRWVLFGAVGAALLYLGITWESRLRNLRSLAASLERIR